MLGGFRPPDRPVASFVLATATAGLVCACNKTFDDPPPPGPTSASWSKSFGDALPQQASSVVADAFGNVYVTGSFEGVADFGGGPISAAGFRDIFVAKYSTDGVHLWSERFGDDSIQEAYAIDLDPNGNPVVVGSFGGGIEFAGDFLMSTDGFDGFVLVLDPEGNPQFGRALPGMGQQRCWAVAVDPATGEIAVGGDFDTDMTIDGQTLVSAGMRDAFVVKLSAALAHVWSRSYGSDMTDDVLESVDVGAEGAVALTGYTAGPIDFGGGSLPPNGVMPNDDAFVAVLDPSGNHVWSKRLGDDEWQQGHDVALMASGELLVVGSFAGTIDFGGAQRTSTGGFDVYVAKLSPVGDPVWSRSFGISDQQEGYRVAVDRQGPVLIAGDFRGQVDFGGEQLTAAGGGGMQCNDSCASPGDGTCQDGGPGSMTSTCAYGSDCADCGPRFGESDVYLAKLDANGNHIASLRFGDELEQSLADLAADTAGNALLVGSYFGSIDFGFGMHQSSGERDAFVAKLSLLP